MAYDEHQGVELTDVVLDSGAIINGINAVNALGAKKVRFIATQNVLNEIKDRRSRQLLAAFPFQIHLQTPSAQAMKAVCDFARLCGEFHELSVTDLEVIALTYQLETEKNGFVNIRKTPAKLKAKKIQVESSTAPSEIESSSASILKPKACATSWSKSSSVSFADMLKKSAPVPPVAQAVSQLETDDEFDSSSDADDAQHTFDEGEIVEEESVEEYVTRMQSEMDQFQKIISEKLLVEQNEREPDDVDQEDDRADIEKEERKEGETINELEEEQERSEETQLEKQTLKTTPDDSSSEGVWITPDNVDRQLEGHWGVSGKKSKKNKKNKLPKCFNTSIACMTSDFGMQNVMGQMGLRILSIEGRTLHRVRHWALGCFGCRAICNDLSKEFCPSCGGHTLIRVGVDSNSRTGEIRYHWNKSRLTTSRRGVKYSIPKPKSGRGAKNIILREDELHNARAKHGRSGAKKHSADDWSDRAVEFGALGFSSGRKNSDIRYGHRRRNPNEVAKKTGNRKKRN